MDLYRFTLLGLMKGAWLWSHDPFKFLVSPKISLERLKLETSNFIQWFAM